MVVSKNKKRILAILIGFIVIIISLLMYLHYWMNNTFPTILNQNPDRVYDIRYSEMYYSIFANTIELSNIVVQPHNANPKDNILNGSIKSISIDDVDFLQLIIDKKITTRFVVLNYPKINITSKFSNKKLASNSQSINKFWGDLYYSIELQNFKINHGEIKINSGVKDSILFYSHDINIELTGVKIDSTLKSTPLPFTYDNFQLNTVETFAKLDEFYTIKASKFNASSTGLKIYNVEVDPIKSKVKFNNKIKKERDFVELKIKLVEVDNTKWGFYHDTLRVQANKLNIKNAQLDLSRNKLVKDDKSIKNLYNKMLRELSFFVSIDSFSVENGEIEYEEKIYVENPPGKLTFKNVSIDGSNLNNFQFDKDSFPTKIHFQSSFCESGNLDALLIFKISNMKDQYQLKGTLSNFDAASTNKYTEPNLNLKISGLVSKVNFLVSGSNYDAKASIGINYKDLKLTFLDDESGNKKILKTLVGNIVIKNSSGKDEMKYAEAYIIRDKTKSMYNQIWTAAKEAIKKIIVK